MQSLEERLARLEEEFFTNGGGGEKLHCLRNFWKDRKMTKIKKRWSNSW